VRQDGPNPIAPDEHCAWSKPARRTSLYAFSYTVPSKAKRKTFVVAGAGELPEGSLDPQDVVRPGEGDATAILEKARFVIGLMERKVEGAQRGLERCYGQRNLHDA
jgi:hypothetical protein